MTIVELQKLMEEFNEANRMICYLTEFEKYSDQVYTRVSKSERYEIIKSLRVKRENIIKVLSELGIEC